MFFTPHIDRRYFLWHNPLVYGVESCLFLNSILLGVGLAMDAFSVSIANALSESGMKKSRMCFIAGVYAFFQFAMPMIGWICVHTIVEYFEKFDDFIPWIATSIDALSVGFTIADYGLLMAFTASVLIALVTFAICMTGLLIGKKAGDRLGSKATLVGGIILVGIGIEIFVKGVFF